MFLRFVEILSMILVILLLATQVIWPLMRGRLVFPFFRKRGKLEAKLNEVREAEDDKQLEAELLDRTVKLNKVDIDLSEPNETKKD